MTATWHQHKRQAEDELAEVAETLRATGAGVETRLLDGGADPTEEILQSARILGSDLIVAGYKGKSLFKSAVLGSVTIQLTEYSPCSVWTVKPHA